MPGSPHFRKPPVVETVLSVQFEKLLDFRVAHFGLLAERFQEQFPVTEDVAPLAPITELFGTRQKLLLEAVGQWTITHGVQLPRVLYKANAGDAATSRMIQVQSDRFVHNWARTKVSNEAYPTYEVNKREFDDCFAKFLAFVEEKGVGRISPNVVEVTYVNRLAIKKGRSATEVVADTFPNLRLTRSDSFLSDPETLTIEQAFSISDNRGRLHAKIRGPVLLKSEEETEEIVDFRLTARVAPANPKEPDYSEMLDLAHLWVVGGFKSLTTPKMHDEWEQL